MTGDSGAEYYRRFLEGDSSAFDELMELYRKNLIFFLLRYLEDPADAEDAAEDAFVELLLHQGRFHFQNSLKTYLYAIGRNKALNLLRRRKRHPSLPLSGAGQLPSLTPLPEELCELREEQAAVSRALSALPPHYREILLLLYGEGMSCREAAQILGKSGKQTENLSYRARNALRERLQKEGFTDERRRRIP